jgi:membrane fusion protein, multidrug efflux system
MTANPKKLLAIGILGILAAGAAYVAVASGPQQQRTGARGTNSDAPIPVLAASAEVADVPVYLDAVGTTKALNTVTVHSQVDGILTKIMFREGLDVKRGDVLAQIDATTYQAQLNQVTAKKALDEAQLANARLDLERYTTLLKTNAVNRQLFDTQRAQVAQLEAQVKLDQGAIDNARAYVNYCTIVSPLDGRIGLRLLDQGNLVHAADVTGIVVITQIRPIAVTFNLPQQRLGQVNKAFEQGPLTVEALNPDGRAVLDTGKLQVINNQVDQTTGTVQMKAEFPNPDLQLWPGQFVNVRLLLDTLRQVVVVPTGAVQRGPNGTFVYVVQPDSTVKVTNVTVIQQDASQAVIANGVEATDQVVTSGFGQIANGRKVILASGSAPQGPTDPATGQSPSIGRSLPAGQDSRSGQSAQNPQGLQSPQGRSEQQTQLSGAATEGSRRYDRRVSEGTRNVTQNAAP